MNCYNNDSSFFKEYFGYDSFLLRHWYLFWHLLGCLCSLSAFWPSVLFQGGEVQACHRGLRIASLDQRRAQQLDVV